MTWTPRPNTETRAEHLARREPLFRVVMPWRVFFAGFVCVGLLLIIGLLLVLAGS